MADTHLLRVPEWVAILSGLLGSGFVATASVWLVRRAHVRYRALRDGIAAFTAMRGTLDTVASDVSWMTKELKPNGGSSLRDSVTRTEQMVAFERIARRASSVHVALYERGARGEPVYVSPAFTALTGLTTEECRDAGWSRVIASGERGRALRAHAAAAEGATFYADEFTIAHHQTGATARVRAEETPVFFADQLVGWLGRWVPIPATTDPREAIQ